MELTTQDLKYIVGGGLNGAGSGAPELPKRPQQQNVDTDSSLVTDPTAPVEPPKP
jgi:hypothetical protein